MPHVTPTHVAAVDRQLCDECGLCMPLCPPMAIHMRREGLLVDAATCTGCRKCIDPCPVGALAMVHNPLLSAFQSSTSPLFAPVTPVTPRPDPVPGATA
jgi:ferredoxin